MVDSVVIEKVGFWSFLLLFILRDFIFPIAAKNFPQLFKRSEREQNREDKRLEFEQQMRLREIEALEGIKNFVESTNNFMKSVDARLERIEGNQLQTKTKKRVE